MSADATALVSQRLKPLYWAAFFQGSVFWYVVDKLLSTEVGVSSFQLGVILAVMSAFTILAEIPSGVLADRWSRKGVLLLSLVSLALSAFFGLIATAAWQYWLMAISWGFYAAMYSGTYEAIVYDTLLEENHDTKHYEKYFGKVGQYESIGLIIGSVAGGLMLGLANIRLPFALSLCSAVVAVIAVSQFREPSVHKHDDISDFRSSFSRTFKLVFSSKVLIAYFFTSLFLVATLRIYWEYTQFWYIELGLPEVWFGIAWSGMLATIWLRSFLANHINAPRQKVLVVSLTLATLLAAVMMFNNPWAAVVTGFLVMLASQVAWLVLSTLQQNLLPSSLRAGATSMFNSAGNIAFMPLGIAFGYIMGLKGVLIAAWVPLVVLILALISSVCAMRMHQDTVK